MAVRPFLIHPDPRLVTSGAPVIRVDAAARADFDAIEAAMAAHGLSALAGPQIGVMRRLAVARWGASGALVRLANLKLIWASRDSAMRVQSCPSLPGADIEVSRATVVTARWFDPSGEMHERVLTGARAAEAQFLVDRLDGVTLLDRATPEARRAALGAIAWARSRGRGAATSRLGGGSADGGSMPPEGEALDSNHAGEALDSNHAGEALATHRGGEALDISGPGEAVAALAPLLTIQQGAPMRLIFMGTPDFSVSALDALIAAGHDIAAVYTQPPRPAGRGKQPRRSPVHTRAEALGLPVRHPASLRGVDEQAALKALNADLAVVVAYGLILPQAVLDAPRLGCVNIHASLLPRWRGAAPIQRAIMAGDAETGVCIMGMEAGLDTGPVLLRGATPIGADDTAATLQGRLAAMGADMIARAITGLVSGALTPIPQPDQGVTYAAKIDKAEAKIDWTLPATDVDRRIRALSPFPGAWFDHDGARIKALLSEAGQGEGEAGEVLDAALTIACGQGAVRIKTVQRAGKGAMATEDAMRGLPIPQGARLG
ncbi:MAG: methionyl-tRNA formyltransferase [Paracoccaceae bacterium]|jgi:methionyl-tRNA formyltransferase